MKTIIHLVLSNEKRSHLANWIDNKFSKRMVSRDEVTQLCRDHIMGMCQAGHEAHEVQNDSSNQIDYRRERDISEPSKACSAGGDSGVLDSSNGVNGSGCEVNSSGEADKPRTELRVPKWETRPTAERLAAACNRVQEHIALESHTDTVNIGWCCSILVAAGVM